MPSYTTNDPKGWNGGAIDYILRAAGRNDAKRQVCNAYPDATFLR